MPSNELLRNIGEDLFHIQVRKYMYCTKTCTYTLNHSHFVIVHNNYEVFVSFLFFCLSRYLSLSVCASQTVMEVDIFGS